MRQGSLIREMPFREFIVIAFKAMFKIERIFCVSLPVHVF